MQKIERILVAIKDVHARSQPALAKAMQVARAGGASIELFHAIDYPVYVDIPGRGDGLREVERNDRARIIDQLRRMAARFDPTGRKLTAFAAWDFPGYEAVIRRARRIGADLIVAQCHTGKHVAPRLLRISDWELVRLSPIPVLIVKDPRPYRKIAVLAAVDPTHAFAKPSTLDAGILEAGRTIGAALRAPLHVLHAWLPSPAGVPPHASRNLIDLAAQVEETARLRATNALERLLRGSAIARSRRHLVEKHPWDAIPATAREIGAGVVVLGAVSRSGLKGVFIGNTAEHVLDRLSCDLLVIKPRNFEARVPRAARGMRIAAALTAPWA